MQNISSEQELRQLLDEGRITEDEYKELLEAIRQKETVQEPVEVPPKPTAPIPRTGYGKAALILMIVGFLLPLASLLINIVISMQAANGLQPKRMVMFTGCPFLFLGFLCLLLAFIFGIIGWKSTPGKIAAIGVPCLGLLIVPGLLLLSVFSYRVANVPIMTDSRHFVGLKTYPLDSMDGVITQEGIEFDPHISSDGKGSLKITTDSAGKTVIRLYETGLIDVENRMLIYSAQIKSALQDGRAYLEMWCDIPGKGEFFSRGLEHPVTGTTDWISFQTPFRLEKGQSPANVKLNLVIEGIGTVWIDDIMLASEFDPQHESCIPEGVHHVSHSLH